MENTRVSHYEVGRLLGRGGMGEVYEALDLDLGRRVALKFVAPEMASDANALQRFEREARSAAALNHPHIATLYAFERDGERTFISMELVGGRRLRDRIQDGPLPVAEALAIARDVAGALALAHRRGIVHRDVKPENLMFDEDGVVKLMDFGLARAAQASRMTMTGSALGTAASMPPESMKDGAGAPGDVFSLGVTLHEMLTGELPFAGDSPLALLYTSANEDPKPLRAARPEAPEAVEDLVKRMLIKAPTERPDAAAVARELAAITGAPPPIGTSDTEELPVERMSVSGERAPVAAGAALEQVPPVRPRRGRLQGIVGIASVLVISSALLYFGKGVIQGWREAVGDDALALNNQGVPALNRGDLDAARRLFTGAVQRAPNFARAQINLARVQFKQGASDSAAQRLQAVLRRTRSRAADARQDRGYAWSVLGDIAVADENWPSAVRNYQEAFQEDSSEARHYNQLGWVLLQAGLGTEAHAVLSRGLARFPTEKALHKNAAVARLALDDTQGAERSAAQALRLDPDYAAAHAAMARVHARLGRRDEALREWSAFLGLPHDPGDSLVTAAELARMGIPR